MVVAVVFFVSAAYSIRTMARAWVAKGSDDARVAGESGTSAADARLARLEQAVDAIALEIERISEGQRFTTRLLSEQARRASTPESLRVSSSTPT
jgi:hypothetical protein